MVNSGVILINQTFVSFIVEEKTNLNFVQLRSDSELRLNLKRLSKHVSALFLKEEVYHFMAFFKSKMSIQHR